MKCPHCQYKTNDTTLLKCAHCGKIFERAPLEELQHIDYLQSWLTAHQAELGEAGERLQADIQAHRNSLEDQLGLRAVDIENISRELALLEAVRARIPLWGQELHLRNLGVRTSLDCLQQRIEELQITLRNQPAVKIMPAEIEILDFAIQTAPGWIQNKAFTVSGAQRLHRQLKVRREEEITRMNRKQAFRKAVLELIPIYQAGGAIPAGLAPNLERVLRSQIEDTRVLLGARQAKSPQPIRLPTIEYAIRSMPAWAARLELTMDDEEVQTFYNHLVAEQQALKQPVAASQRVAALPVSPPVATPAPRPRKVAQTVSTAPVPTPAMPERPPFDWGKLWEKTVQAAVSGALMRGLLYLGAFMIVISLTILVVRFWDLFPPVVQAIFIFSVPTIFYAAGWIIRARLKLPQAGNALTGVGALLLAVDFAAIYQFGGLQIAFSLYWLAAGLFCALVYAITAWRLAGIFFDYIALLAGTNLLVALTRLLNLPLEWSSVAVTAASGLMAAASTWLGTAGDGWRDTARATRYLPQVLIPVSLALILFTPGSSAAGQAVAFSLASLGYGFLAWSFRGALFTHAAVWSSVSTLGFALRALALPGEWFGAAAALLGTTYTLGAGWLGGRIPPDDTARRRVLLAPNLAGIFLVVVAILLGFANLSQDHRWPGVAALALAALVLAFWSHWFHRPLLAALAAGLFCVPFSVALADLLSEARVFQWTDWLMAALTDLALAYLSIAVLLRRAEKHAMALYIWVQILPIAAGLGLLGNYLVQPDSWYNLPALAALAGMMLVYLALALVHARDEHPGLSSYITGLFPGAFGQAAFIWPLALLLPVWISIAWSGSILIWEWLGAAFAGLGLAYLLLGQLLRRSKSAYRLPWHATALLLALAGVVAALGYNPALMVSLYLDVILLAGLAVLRRSTLAVAAASVLFILPFQITLDLLSIRPHAQSVAYALLVCLAYLPLGLWLHKAGRKYALPAYVVAYGLSVFALLGSLMGRFGAYPSDLPWVGVVTPMIITGLYGFSLYRFRQPVFAWAGALTLAIAYGQLLTLLRVPPVYNAGAWAGLAGLYMLVGWGLSRASIAWLRLFRLPLGVGSAALGFSALALTAGPTAKAFFYTISAAQQPPLILAQAMVAGLAILAAMLFRSRWPLYLVPWLAFLPATMFFVGYGELLFGVHLTSFQFGLVWSCLGMAHLLAATVLDSHNQRYAHGLYLGGYALALLAIFWTVAAPAELTWTLGLWVLICAASALSVHALRHKTWHEIMAFLFGQRSGKLRLAVHDTFLWLSAWLFPVWCTLLLSQLNSVAGYHWLGFSLPALAFLGLAVALARLQRAYAWPFVTAGQFYTALALLVSAPLTFSLFGGSDFITTVGRLTALAFILVQICAVIYYVLFAAIYRQRVFAHVASFLLFSPYTLAWITYSRLSSAEFSLPWMGLATFLLAAGFALDRRPERYSHGPYLAGYLLAIFALLWSIPYRLGNLYVLGLSVLLALSSQLLVHFRRQAAFDDLLDWLLRRQSATSTVYRSARTLFLFFAAYSFPVWLTLLLGYNQVDIAWRGLALALLAPLYIAAGLALHRVREEYIWPLYSMAYALTAIGAMMSFDNLTLATFVLLLDAVVYAASAYIFRQAFWLYLSNVLVPVIALLALNLNGRLAAPWVAGAFMALAYLYFVLGSWFDRRDNRQVDGHSNAERRLSAYALPFYFPGYLLSAVSLAIASGEGSLAMYVYLAGAALYALSARAFRENLFLYPAAWLAAVPYYLAMALTPLPEQWYGLGWLPLILAYILLSRYVFHKRPLDLRRAAWLSHPAMPFYLLAYSLSISMIALSAGSPLVQTLAYAVAAAVYFGSASLFRRSTWIYPGLLAAHLALLALFNIRPSSGLVHYISLPFLIVTWVMALAGYVFRRLKPVARQAAGGKLLFKLWKWELDFGNLPSIGYLITPSWAQPFFIFALLDMFTWQLVALFGFDTAIMVALGIAILLGLFAMLWRDQGLAYGSLAFVLLAAGARLIWVQVTLAEALAWFGGIGFGAYLVGRLVEVTASLHSSKSSRLVVWLKPLVDLPVALTALAVIGTLPYSLAQTAATAASLAFAGALYLAIAYRGRYYHLGYLAIGMLEAAWVMALVVRDVRQPQLYAIPAGLYFTLLAYLEKRRGRRLFVLILQGLGLAVLLVTSFIQSLDWAQGFPYFVLLLVEAMLVIWWGAVQRQKLSFFAGLGASVLNVVAQVVVLVSVYEVNRWFIILGVGLVLVVLAAIVERRRERLLIQAQAWREALESWN